MQNLLNRLDTLNKLLLDNSQKISHNKNIGTYDVGLYNNEFKLASEFSKLHKEIMIKMNALDHKAANEVRRELNNILT
jgi:hypothetical protein